MKGKLVFLSGIDDETVEEVVEPRSGRVVIFTSGAENPHRVERVTRGKRFVLAFWFTVFENRKFDIFLDGKAHISFAEKKTSYS